MTDPTIAMITNLADLVVKAFTLGYETGRKCVPEGGMPLTAEQVEDVKIVLGQLERGGPAFEAAHERLRALFPATEPAEDLRVHDHDPYYGSGPEGHCRERMVDGRLRGDCMAYATPAPAVPAEEETKAEWPVHDSWCTGTHGRAGNCIDTSRWIDPPIATAETHMEKMVRKGSIAKFLERTLVAGDGWHLPTGWDPGVLAGAIVYGVTVPASSPVVPAPTETGPWHAVAEIPKAVACIKDREGDVWRRCGSGWEHGALHDPVDYSPFVAAEEGDA